MHERHTLLSAPMSLLSEWLDVHPHYVCMYLSADHLCSKSDGWMEVTDLTE